MAECATISILSLLFVFGLDVSDLRLDAEEGMMLHHESKNVETTVFDLFTYAYLTSKRFALPLARYFCSKLATAVGSCAAAAACASRNLSFLLMRRPLIPPCMRSCAKT